MSTAVESIRTGLASVVGEARVVSDEATCAAYAVDGKVPRHVVYPASAEEVAAVLKWAVERDLAIIPCRNATKLEIGNPPRRYDVALSLKELNRIWHYEPADLTVTAEAGMKFGDFQHFLGRRRLWLPLDPFGGERASLGGILATNSAGPLRMHFGSPRDMVLGMKIATTEGKLVKTGGRVVKNVAGFDLAKLLIGSYGTLGVIVEASLKLFPLPAERATFVMPVKDLDVARELRRKISKLPVQPLRLALLNPSASLLTRGSTRPAVDARYSEMWIEAGGTPRIVERFVKELEGLARDLCIEPRRIETEDARSIWERIGDFRPQVTRAHANAMILKATLPPAASEKFLGQAHQECQAAGLNLYTFSSFGIAHLCLAIEASFDVARATIQKLRKAAGSLGGALVVERCPAEIKAGFDVWGSPGDDYNVMRKLKLAWDPKGILSPGRYLGGL